MIPTTVIFFLLAHSAQPCKPVRTSVLAKLSVHVGVSLIGVPGVEVTLAAHARKWTTSGSTDHNGDVTFADLQPGSYSLSITCPDRRLCGAVQPQTMEVVELLPGADVGTSFGAAPLILY